MPKTIIVTSELKSSQDILNKLVEKKVVQMISHRGVFVFGRHYLTKAQVRDAYKRTQKGHL